MIREAPTISRGLSGQAILAMLSSVALTLQASHRFANPCRHARIRQQASPDTSGAAGGKGWRDAASWD